MNKIILGILFLLTATIGLAQDTNAPKKKISERKQLKNATTQQISQCYEGALLVRLKTRKHSIEALRKIGENKLADKSNRCTTPQFH